MTAIITFTSQTKDFSFGLIFCMLLSIYKQKHLSCFACILYHIISLVLDKGNVMCMGTRCLKLK